MSRTARQSKILEIITKSEIETQEDLVSELDKSGLSATQATISRDIKELGLIKVSTDKNTYKYAVISATECKLPQKYIVIFRESIVAIIVAGNLLVVKTLSGSAGVVATVIEQLNTPEVIGCVAGDDTIIVVSHTQGDAEQLKIKLTSMI